MTTLLVDTGPLVALINDRERNHAWARDFFSSVTPPLVTCEPVLTEACHIVRRFDRGPNAVLEFLAKRILTCQFQVSAELGPIRGLMKRFASVPMSLADACLVRTAELYSDAVVVTLDNDFHVYRRNRNQTIPTIMPT